MSLPTSDSFCLFTTHLYTCNINLPKDDEGCVQPYQNKHENTTNTNTQLKTMLITKVVCIVWRGCGIGPPEKQDQNMELKTQEWSVMIS